MYLKCMFMCSCAFVVFSSLITYNYFQYEELKKRLKETEDQLRQLQQCKCVQL